VSAGLLVVSSCTASKVKTPEGSPRAAEALYTGQQHVRLMRGVSQYRQADHPAGRLRFRILSAFYGVLAPGRRVFAYDHTFSGASAALIRGEARDMGIPADVRRLLARPFDAAVLLLGEPYLRACDLDADLRLGGPVLSFCSPAVARRMPRIKGLRTIALTNAEAQRFSCGLIALKGELGGRLLSRLSADPGEISVLRSPRSDILAWLEGAPVRDAEQTAA
jgi:hypothetical protein